jgi:hypothetical protein
VGRSGISLTRAFALDKLGPAPVASLSPARMRVLAGGSSSHRESPRTVLPNVVVLLSLLLLVGLLIELREDRGMPTTS